jgi:polyisoprenoid-binding protein YceI
LKKHVILLQLAAAGLALLPASLQAQTSTWAIDPAHSSVQFSIRHMGVSTVHGSLNGVKGTVLLDEKDFTKSSVQATIDATTLTTSNDKRDQHLKSPDFFNVAESPTLTFKSTKIVRADGKQQIVGDLTIRGITKSVTLDVDGPAPPQKGPQGKTISGFSATGVLSRTEFNFGPKFAPPVLGDEVKFTIDVEIDKQ